MKKMIAILSMLTISSTAFASVDKEQICLEYLSLAQVLSVAPNTKAFLFCQGLVKTKLIEQKLKSDLQALLLASNQVVVQFAPVDGGGTKSIQAKSIRFQYLNCNVDDDTKATCTADIAEACSVGVGRVEFRDLEFGRSPLELSKVVGFKADCGSFD